MKTAFVLFVAALVLGAAYLVFINRASEKILTAVFPIVVAAIAAIFITVFVISGEPVATAVFPSSFIYQKASKMPADLPGVIADRRFLPSFFAPVTLHKDHPEFFNDPADENGAILYHHFLQRAIVDWMGFYYASSWRIELLQFDLPFGRQERAQPLEGASQKSKILSTAEIAELLKGNKFADIHANVSRQIALPSDTEVNIRPPQQGSSGEIHLKNTFCSISIKTEFYFWSAGAGAYKALGGFTDEDNARLGTATYLVRIKSEFNRWRSGHPEMALYKAWASKLTEGLRTAFDEQAHWSKAKEDVVFQKQLEQFRAIK